MAVAQSMQTRSKKSVSSSAKKHGNGRRKTMTTSLMEIYSIEVGDIVIVNGDLYTVVNSDYADDGDDIVLTLVDEEGSRKRLRGPTTKEVSIVVNEYV
jgi:hypothetical protein